MAHTDHKRFYPTAQAWCDAPYKQVSVFGMSGLGKTRISNMLRTGGDWFHYSVDYRIGTRYMDEHIVDNFKRHAMRDPFLAPLLLSDSIYIASNIAFDNLTPLATYIGKPGNPALGGINIDEYQNRQRQHHRAEIAALQDTPHFISRARELYGYNHFICDSGGSICEVVNPDDPNDPILSTLAEHMLLVWIRHTADHTQALIDRFRQCPKPMYYHPEFLTTKWAEYKRQQGQEDDAIDPDKFAIWMYAQVLEHRQPLYAAMAKHWGITVDATDVANLRTPDDFTMLIETALPTHI